MLFEGCFVSVYRIILLFEGCFVSVYRVVYSRIVTGSECTRCGDFDEQDVADKAVALLRREARVILCSHENQQTPRVEDVDRRARALWCAGEGTGGQGALFRLFGRRGLRRSDPAARGSFHVPLTCFVCLFTNKL